MVRESANPESQESERLFVHYFCLGIKMQIGSRASLSQKVSSIFEVKPGNPSAGFLFQKVGEGERLLDTKAKALYLE